MSNNMFDSIGNLFETLNLDLREDYTRKLGEIRVHNLDTEEVHVSEIKYYADDELEDLLEDVKGVISEAVLEVSSDLVFSNFLYDEDPSLEIDLITTRNQTINLYKGTVSGLKAYFRGDDFENAILRVPEIQSWGAFDKRRDNEELKIVEADVNRYKSKLCVIINCYIDGKPETIYIDIDSIYNSIFDKYEFFADADLLGSDITRFLESVHDKIQDYLDLKYSEIFKHEDLKDIYEQIDSILENDILDTLSEDSFVDDEFDLEGDLEEGFDVYADYLTESADQSKESKSLTWKKDFDSWYGYSKKTQKLIAIYRNNKLTIQYPHKYDNGDYYKAVTTEVTARDFYDEDLEREWSISHISGIGPSTYIDARSMYLVLNDLKSLDSKIKPQFITDSLRVNKVEEAFDDDDFEVSEQEFSSAETANGNGKANGGLGRVPALFTRIKYPSKGLVFDYGCGKESTVQQITNYLKSQNIDYAGYDKFNRTPSQNSEALKKVRAAGGADIATSANVLNVIKERDIRVNEVIRNMYKLLRAGGVAYFDVYSDKKKEGPKQTGKDKWQEFRGIDTYVEEVAEIFGEDNVQLKGSIIIARK